MGASAGPSLQGIGRGGASNLVLEMDAHDAKSYPGEPTTNLIAYPHYTGATLDTGQTSSNAGWGTTWVYEISEIPGPNGTTVRAFSIKLTAVVSPFIYSASAGPYNVAGINSQYANMTSGTTYTASCWSRVDMVSGGGHTNSNHIYFTGAASYGTASTTVNPEWTHISVTLTPGVTGNYRLAHFFYDVAIGDKIWFTMPQIEEKGYATPFVRSQLLDFSQQGYSARPATTNLMIHGNVGTGQSFSDSSPSGHTITANGDVTHSGGQSKFSGGSIYFDSDADYLSMPDSSDWDFGNGDFTIDFWLGYPTDTGAWAEVFSQGWVSGSDSWMIGIDWGTTNKLKFIYTTDGSTDIPTAYTTSTISTSAWTHIAVVRSTTTIKIYVNGIEEVSLGVATNTIYNSSKPLYIGQREISVGSYDYVGYMDEIRITKGTALWTHAFTPPTRRNLSAPVVDRSGNDNGGNFATKETTDVTNYRVGEVIRPIDNAVWDFDGTDDAILVGSSGWNYINNYDVSGPFTISLWVYPESGGSTLQGLLINGEWSSLVWVTYFIGLQSNRLKFQGYGASSAGFSIYPTQTLGTGAWHHVVGTFNGTTATDGARLYVDGVLYDSATSTAASVTYTGKRGGIYLGSDYSNNTAYFTGKMGAVQFYKGALTAQQVKENFNQQSSRFNVPNWRNRDIVKDGLVAWYDAGISASYPGSGSTWSDISGNGYDGTITGATYSTDGGGSIDFTGSGDNVNVRSNLVLKTEGGWTIESWVKADAVSGGPYNFTGHDSPDTVGWYWSVYNSKLAIWNKAPGVWKYGSTTLSTGVWMHCVCVSENAAGTSYKMYLNGVIEGGTCASYTFNGAGDYKNLEFQFIGRASVAHGRFWNGKYAVNRMYTKALSASEIEQNFIVQRQRFGI